MQYGMGDPPRLETGPPGAAPGADHQQVGPVRGGRAHPAGRTLHRGSAQFHVRRSILERLLQNLGGLLLVRPCGFTGEQRVVGALVRRAPPGPYGLGGTILLTVPRRGRRRSGP